MFVIMMLLTHTTGEWVEISQQHYKKPLHHNFAVTPTEMYFEDSRPGKIYANQTVTENLWHKGIVSKVPKLGSVQRVQLEANVVKAPNIRGSFHDPTKFLDKNYNGQDSSAVTNEDQMEFNDERGKLNPERVFDNFNTGIERNRFRNGNVKGTEEKTESLHRFQTESDSRTSVRRKQNNRESLSATNINKRNKTKIDYKGHVATEIDNEDVFNIKPFNKIDVSTEPYTTRVVEIFTNPKPIRHNNNRPVSFEKNTSLKNDYDGQSSEQILSKKENPKEIHKYESDRDTNARVPTNPFQTNEERIVGNDDKVGNEDSSNFASDQGNTVESIIKFMKVVTDTIKRNTRRSVGSKTRYLNNLKDIILASIEERIETAWPDDNPTQRSRRHAEPRGHLEVPSSESALMSISFLTFAVFLIKLVLQVIQTYKNKTLMVAPTVVAAVGRVATAPLRNKQN